MGPVKASQPNMIGPVRKTRSQAALSKANVLEVAIEKRKAEASPGQKRITKRSAFGDLTNAGGNRLIEKNPVQKVIASKAAPRFKEDRLAVENSRHVFSKQKTVIPKIPLQNSISQPSMKSFCKLVKPSMSVTLRSKVASKPKIEEVAERIKAVSVSEVKKDVKEPVPSEERGRPSDSSENSLYITAVEEPELVKPEVNEDKPPVSRVPPGVVDFDAETWTDPFQASIYAMDIFNYLKEREAEFPIDNYISRQKNLNIWMRSLLVDWMVEVQETFELNHETLYLAVKLVDLYLCKNIISKETLQLIGAASIFIASKYDEQIPPLVDDFLYICDGAYTRPELISMERNIVKSMDFNLGIPLSYRFLRRYARCGKIPLSDLTLARYILELSLMDYSFISESDSKLAAAALLLALCMLQKSEWTLTLEYFSGYKVADLEELAERLNKMLHAPPKEKLVTIRNKYSHKVFYEVAKTPLIKELNL